MNEHHRIRNIVHLFDNAVHNGPDTIAVDHEDGTLTYRQLNHASNILCEEVLARHVGSGDPVILLTAHGTRNIISVLAILKAGATYVPIDRDTWSEQRIEYVVNAVRDCSLILNTTREPFLSKTHDVYHFDDVLLTKTKQPLRPQVRPSIRPNDTACIIFTSGSTGKPKGVMLTHEAISNYGQTTPFNMQVKKGDRVLHILSVAFDASTGMLFSVLANCGTVVPSTLNDLYQKATSCTILASTPSILASLPLPSAQENPYSRVHTVLLGGESPPVALLRSWLDVGVKILNAYGPTETTCASTMQIVEKDDSSGEIRNSIIGKPMPQCPVFLLAMDDEEIEDDEVDGEIVVRGCSLAKGYYMDPDRTEAKFGSWRGHRIYRTGDVGRWTHGNGGRRVLEFRGRRDRIVKNRGFLVNLEADVEIPVQKIVREIEMVFATVFRGKLVVLVSPATVNADALRNSLKHELSSFHVPDLVIPVDHFTLSPNGKIDPQQVAKFLDQTITSEETSDASPSAESSPSDTLRRHMATVLSTHVDNLCSEDDFFAKGGNSLDVLRLCSLCRGQGVHLSPIDVFTGRTWPGILTEVNKRAKQDDQSDDARESLPPPISPFDGLDQAPLTPQQLEFCVPTVECSGRCTNQIRKRYCLTYVNRLKSAWKTVWEFEPLFRTEISLDIELGVQIVGPRLTFELVEKTVHTQTEYEAEVQKCGLEVGCGMRFDLIKYVPEDHKDGEVTLIWTVHHALLDGYSLAIVLSQVEQAAKGLPLLPSPSFLNAAQNLIVLQHERDNEARSFWSHYLDGVGADLSRIARRTESIQRSSQAKELRFNLAGQVNALSSMVASARVTVATIYYTAWAIALCARTGNSAIVIGAVNSGRYSMMEFMDAIGPLMATLPLLVRLRPELSVIEQLTEVMSDLSVCSEYSWSKPDQINHKLSNLVATQYDFPRSEEVIPSLSTEYFENSDFPLSLLIEDQARFRLVFDDSCFSDDFISKLASDFTTAVDHLLTKPNIGACLIQAEQAKASSPNASPMPSETASVAAFGMKGLSKSEANIAVAFEESVDLHADLPAVEGPDGCLTYAELDAFANAVAHEIRTLCKNTKTVAIYADGSTKWIVGILGILKAGCAYCPIDPAYSLDRRLSVYTQGGASAILIPCSAQAPEIPCQIRDDPVIVVESILANPDRPQGQSRNVVSPSSDALIVFTSGTTGRPKGVPISHRGLLALQSNPEARMFSRPGLRIAQYMSPAFDYCANEIFSALLHGGTLVLRDPCDQNAHLSRADAATITPSVLTVLDPEDFRNLSVVYATGEPVPPTLVDIWAPGRLFYNAYGPAECSICTSFTRLVPGMPVTIGRPIRTARMYVLDSDFRQVDVGTHGEIFLAGVQVMRGYIGADEQTKQRVMPDPWCPGSTMYRTGDYGYVTKDGNISYIGRVDRQIKIRGYRVELPTIEQKVYELDHTVELAAVLPVNGNLVAFVRPRTVDSESLLQKLTAVLQPSWVPQRVVALESFPMTVNKKIDFELLIKNGSVTVATNGTPQSHDRVEELISEQWIEVLELPENSSISTCQDFMELGGHSVILMLLAVRLSKVFGTKISVKNLLSAPLLRDQVKMVRRLLGEMNGPGVKGNTSLCERQLTHLEQQAWFQYQVGTSTTTFNIPVLLHIDEKADMERLADALDTAMATRKVLGSNFIATNNGPVRLLRASSPKTRRLDTLDVEREVSSEFDLEKDELIRVFMCGRTILIIISHAIADLNSIHALLRQTSRMYRGGSAGEPQFAYLSSETWNSAATKANKDYWVEKLRHSPKALPLESQPSTAVFEGTSRTRIYEGNVIERLAKVMSQHSVTKHQLVSTAVAQALQWLCQTDDIVLGSPYENRHSEQDVDSVGLFLDRIPLRIKSPTTSTTADLLQETRRVSQEALSHAIPFHELMALLGVHPTLERHPIFQAMVTFHMRGVTERSLRLPECTVRRQDVFPPGAKFLLMFEWTELERDKWSLRVEYDSTRVDEEVVSTLEEALEVILKGLAFESGREALQGDLSLRLGQNRSCSSTSAKGRIVETIRSQMAACLEIDVDTISNSYSFFDSGANSLSAYRLHRRLKRVGLEVPIADIFNSPTPEGLASALCT